MNDEISRKCPICKKSKHHFLCRVYLVLGKESELLRCDHCLTSFFYPLPSPRVLCNFYSDDYISEHREDGNLGKGMAFAGKLNKIKKKGNFLDVGSAKGYFLKGLSQKSNWDMYGVELNNNAAKFSQDKLGLNVRQGDIAGAGFADSFFDFIHVNNVLEHVLDPVRMLLECRRIIKDDGVLFLSVPNGPNDCLPLVRYYKEEGNAAYSPKGHIFFFDKKSLRYIFEACGFQSSGNKTYGLKRGLRNLGLIPAKSNWKADYSPENLNADPIGKPAKDRETVLTRLRYPILYYHYRLFKVTMGISGLFSFGLDYFIYLKPRQILPGRKKGDRQDYLSSNLRYCSD